MARLFTVPFQYREQTYTAVVYHVPCNGTPLCPQYTRLNFAPYLGESNLSVDVEHKLPIGTPAFTPAQKLLVSIMATIEQPD